jgi:hypothetical protein
MILYSKTSIKRFFFFIFLIKNKPESRITISTFELFQMDEIKSRKEEESNLVSTLRRVRYNIYVHQKS